MIFINRFYTYIAEAQKGSRQYKTLSEMWTGVVATNAIHEIAETSKKFFDWIWGLNSKGKIRMMDFAMERSVGRLRGSTVYADTILVVKEMLGRSKNVYIGYDMGICFFSGWGKEENKAPDRGYLLK